MARKLVQLALLIAGLFLSIKSFASDECTARAGDTINLLEFGSSTCPVLSSWTISGVRCELVQLGDQICALSDNGTTYSGGPYVFTGGIASDDTESPIQPPDEEPPHEFDVPPELPTIDPVAVTPGELRDPNAANALVQIQNELVNQRILSQNVLDNIYNMVNDNGVSYFALNNNVRNSKFELLNAINARSWEIRSAVGSLSNNVSYFHTNILNRLDAQHLQTARNETASTNEILTAIANNKPVDEFLLFSKLDGIDEELANFSNNLNFIATAEQQSEIREQEILSELSTNTFVSSNAYTVTQQNRDRLDNLKNDVFDLTVSMSEISNLLRDDEPPPACGGIFEPPCEPCGGMMEPPCDDGGGGGSDDGGSFSAVDKQNLQTVADASQEISQGVRSVIQGVDYVDQSLGVVIDKLDVINETLAAGTGSGSGSDLTETNNKLDTIADGINDLSESLASGTGQKSGPSTCQGKECWKAASWVESSYPDGVAGLWEARKVAFELSVMNEYLHSLIPNIGGNSGLQPFELCFDMGFAQYGCHSFTVPPYVIAFIRICLLITAGFYCQRLVFGGA
ncbi:hypothetical protein EMM73_16060 [Rheinheimera sediminis]|uniref:hypothetical protein n=1 Tax=Rheinheimera sp. YQF-1 TaxID=2499626 RepID=UPI000FDA2A42|nr:hypothetical protein [Rheinheimera sp. YQF-1]RVT44646.1 hypothetical protein EMM73_16060 [Rheinheimera sp. YQF-1]